MINRVVRPFDQFAITIPLIIRKLISAVILRIQNSEHIIEAVGNNRTRIIDGEINRILIKYIADRILYPNDRGIIAGLEIADRHRNEIAVQFHIIYFIAVEENGDGAHHTFAKRVRNRHNLITETSVMLIRCDLYGQTSTDVHVTFEDRIAARIVGYSFQFRQVEFEIYMIVIGVIRIQRVCFAVQRFIITVIRSQRIVFDRLQAIVNAE